jgi:hypothetical protein
LQKELLDKAAAKYAANIYQAEDYLASRGITREVARLARFGVVGEPEVGHEQFQGRLSIPYITKTGVVDLRFRSLNPAVEPKYMGLTGAETKMYNVLDIDRAGDWIGVCEGELDAITLSVCVGVPCIGVPGANSWKIHYTLDCWQILKESLFLQTETNQEKNLLTVYPVSCQSPSCKCQTTRMSTLAMSNTVPSIFEKEWD